MATVFASQLAAQALSTFLVEADSLDLNEFYVMAEMGFFILTGKRYQLVIPPDPTWVAVRRAYQNLVSNVRSDDDWIHPEGLIVHIPIREAYGLQARLSAMDPEQRMAARAAALVATSYNSAEAIATTALFTGERDA